MQDDAETGGPQASKPLIDAGNMRFPDVFKLVELELFLHTGGGALQINLLQCKSSFFFKMICAARHNLLLVSKVYESTLCQDDVESLPWQLRGQEVAMCEGYQVLQPDQFGEINSVRIPL